MCLCYLFSAKTAWQLVNRKADFFYKTNRFESICITNRFESRIEMLCTRPTARSSCAATCFTAANVGSATLSSDIGSWTQTRLMIWVWTASSRTTDVCIFCCRSQIDHEMRKRQKVEQERDAAVSHSAFDWIDFIWFNTCYMPSVLWRCWLGGRKGIRPVKTEWCGASVVICLEQGPADATATHCLFLQ